MCWIYLFKDNDLDVKNEESGRFVNNIPEMLNVAPQTIYGCLKATKKIQNLVIPLIQIIQLLSVTNDKFELFIDRKIITMYCTNYTAFCNMTMHLYTDHNRFRVQSNSLTNHILGSFRIPFVFIDGPHINWAALWPW